MAEFCREESQSRQFFADGSRHAGTTVYTSADSPGFFWRELGAFIPYSGIAVAIYPENSRYSRDDHGGSWDEAFFLSEEDAMFGSSAIEAGSGGGGSANKSSAGAGAATEFASTIQTQQKVNGPQPDAGDGGGASTVPAPVTLTVIRGGVADETSGDTFETGEQDGEQDRPAADGTYGKTEHIVSAGETLQSIAEEHGQSVDDVLLANPAMTETTALQEGDVVAIYDETRLGIASEMTTTTDPERLNELVQEEIQYATGNSPTPDDLLPAVQRDIMARRPGDPDMETVFANQANVASGLWRSQGRTHEVMDPIFALSASGDQEALGEHIQTIFRTVAETSPRSQDITGQMEILRRYGPQTDAFVETLESAEAYFTTEYPQQVAAEIAAEYENEGPVAAAELLAERTRAGAVDPLTATRILELAQPTIEQIVVPLRGPGRYDWPGNEGDDVYLDHEDMGVIFDSLNQAVDNASRSPEATSVIETAARLVNEQGFLAVQVSIENGSGVVLPLEMLKQNGDWMLGDVIAEAIENFKQDVRDSVAEMADTALEVTEPAALWGGLIDNPDAAFEATLDHVREDGRTLRQMLQDDLFRINTQGYQLTRIIEGVELYAPYLSDYEQIRSAAALPAEGSDPALETALGMPSALAETLRSANLSALADRSVLDPYSVISDPSWFSRMLRNTARSFGRAYLGQNAAFYGTGTGRGMGATLFGVGTYGAGLLSNIERWNAGWRTQGLTILNGLGVTLEAGLALSGVYARANGLVGLGQAELQALSPFNREMALATSGNPASRLMWLSKLHLRGFGVLNLLSAIDAFASGDREGGFALTAAGLGTLTSTSSAEIAAGLGRAGNTVFAARIAFFGGLVTTLASGYLLLRGLHEHMERAAFTEPFQRTYLEAAGIRPEIANLLADNDWYGTSTAPFVEGLSNYLNLQPGEMLTWFNAQSPEQVREFLGYAFEQTNAYPDVPFAEFGIGYAEPYMTYDDLDAIILRAQEMSIPLPDHRGEG
jgi:hypothetical protein